MHSQKNCEDLIKLVLENLSESFMSNERLSATNIEPPGGKWSSRRPSTKVILAALFKKQFLIKFRKASDLIEFTGSCIIYLLLVPCYLFTRLDHPAEIYPQLNYTSIIPMDLFIFLGATSRPTMVFAPDCNRTRVLFGTLINLTNLFLPSNITIVDAYVETSDEIRETIYTSEGNGLGINWVNARYPNATYSPEIELYRQSIFGAPDKDVFEIIRRAIAIQNGDLDMFLFNLSDQSFASTKHDEYFPIAFLVVLFSVLPGILVLMPDFQTVLDEKDTKVASLSFLMGCPEAAYWFVSFITPTILGLIPYLLMSICYSYFFIMVGTSVTLIWFISFAFVISHVWFQLFLSTFMKNASQGRSTIIVFLVFAVFFCYLHYFYTLDPKNHNQHVKHAFSILPLSAYQLTLMAMYNQTNFGFPGEQWSDITLETSYPIYYGLFWLFGDALIYFLLFLLFNLTNPREFGMPLIRWRDIFSPSAWKRVFQRTRTTIDNLEQHDEGIFLSVRDLSKTYNGSRKFQALSDVNFDIKCGEVIVIIGPNGAGKSTLLNCIAGAIDPTTGTLSIYEGQQINRFSELQKYMGVCFQENVLIGQLTVRENFHLFGSFRGISKQQIEESISFFSETLQLDEMLDQRAENLSGGQKRKLCIALSLLGNPPLVIMDEPTAAVDVQARQLIWKTLSSLRDTTCVITSHALEEAEACSSRLFIMSYGHLKFTGSSTELRNQFKCGYLLRVDTGNNENYDIHQILELAQSFVPETKISDERSDTICMPVDDIIPEFLEEMEKRKKDLGISSYSFSVEQIEDVILKLIIEEEAAQQGNNIH